MVKFNEYLDSQELLTFLSVIGNGRDTSCVEWFLYLDNKREDEGYEPLAELTHTTDKDFHNIVNAEDWDRADIG